MRMPRPPPPATALIISAPPAPSERRKARASSRLVGPCVAGITGTPQRCASARASTLSPKSASTSADGPTKRRPALAQRSAKSGCSLRKP